MNLYLSQFKAAHRL